MKFSYLLFFLTIFTGVALSQRVPTGEVVIQSLAGGLFWMLDNNNVTLGPQNDVSWTIVPYGESENVYSIIRRGLFDEYVQYNGLDGQLSTERLHPPLPSKALWRIEYHTTLYYSICSIVQDSLSPVCATADDKKVIASYADSDPRQWWTIFVVN
ncbi:hypothetical protein RclHR1_00820005 [Rhizophagus clarus]|uniref:Ricin B lectin domain-containing protein n=1 Tax=Rhizophagus clarus TaxID=94130 RepID=A0A2Z6RZL2_9GLOM|nr:hypothetical protein RclHR1_00820005 [Rhizophagus clarus]